MAPVPSQTLFHFRRIVLDPSVNGGVVDVDASFFHHLFEITIADAILAVPADALENDLALEVAPFEVVHSFIL
jgi:hypothetical protein